LAASHNGRRGRDGDCTYLIGQEGIGKLRGDRAGGPTIDAAEGAGGLTSWAVEEIEARELGGIEALELSRALQEIYELKGASLDNSRWHLDLDGLSCQGD
jgi:hypothetical protein